MRFPNGTYEPEVVALMGAAFNNAREQAQKAGIYIAPAPLSDMACRLLAALDQGERDLGRLTEWALHGLDASKFPAPADQISSRDPGGEGLRIER